MWGEFYLAVLKETFSSRIIYNIDLFLIVSEALQWKYINVYLLEIPDSCGLSLLLACVRHYIGTDDVKIESVFNISKTRGCTKIY